MLFRSFVNYGVGAEERIDMDQVRDLALEHRPRMIVAGTTSYPRRIDPEPFKAIADEVGALLLFDIAHLAGLVAGGAHPNPVPYADVVTFTTHKTLRGPRGGCILSKAEHAAAVDKAVFPGWQGGPLEHVIAGKAVAFREAMSDHFRDYAHRIVANASALAAALAENGFRMVSGGTDTHMIVVDLRTFDARAWRGVVDCVLAGFPCQPFSVAGKQLAERDERHLWPDIARIVREVEPSLVFLENVPGILVRGQIGRAHV